LWVCSWNKIINFSAFPIQNQFSFKS
jgi:hypothetical protein